MRQPSIVAVGVRRAAAAAGPLAVSALAGLVSGCESTQDTSARLQREGAKAISHERGLVITAKNPDVSIVRTAVLSDQNGTAAVVILRNRKPAPLGVVPIAINVLGRGGKSVFKNNTPGLEPSLVSTAALPPGGELAWVNDQVTPSGKAVAVKAEAGTGGTGAPRMLPKIEIGTPKVINDPTSGLEVTGSITNRSSLPQLKIFIYVVGWRGGSIVCAGRGAIQRLNPAAHVAFHVYPIGNPHDASRFTIAAPPTVLR
jgi:hypothetical protein